MAQVESGDKVKVHYEGKLEDGSTFDSSAGRDPLEFTVGSQQVIPGFDNGVVGMEEGAKKKIEIAPDQAYGEHREDLVVDVDKSSFPEDQQPTVGASFQAQSPDGRVTPVKVIAVEGDKVTLDANHPLAGKTLVFEVEMVEITKAG